MQNLDYQQPSEKDIVQPEDISNVPTKKCLENIGLEFEKYVDVDKQLKEQLRKDTEYYHNVLKSVLAIVKYLAIRGLPFRGTEEDFGSPHKDNFKGALEPLEEFGPFIHEHIEQRALRPKSLISVRFHVLHGSHSVFGYPNNHVSERCPVPIDSDKRCSTV
ncbi:zinc finger MYM-type protein 1 [Trichonephila clavipes]|nr:zinc finger MYM-type protein 1 [Trichonephila clavipes]